jgi:hypothetical protein
MLSNQATPSLVHHYKQFPLNDEPFNKKVQKHIPQRIDVVGKSAEFTIKTGLLELLPDECMVGVECCFMKDAVPLSSETYELGRIRSEYDWKPLNVNGRKFRPVVNVKTVDNDVIQVRNVPGTSADYGPGETDIIVQTKEFMPVSNLAAPFDVVTYTWQFMGWGFQSSISAEYLAGITNVDLPSNFGAGPSPFPKVRISGYSTDSGSLRMIVTSIVNNPDSSQSLIIYKYNPYPAYVGQLVTIDLPGSIGSGLVFTVYEIIDSYSFKIIMSPVDVGTYGLTGAQVGAYVDGQFLKNDVVITGIGSYDTPMIPGTIFKLYQFPDRTCSWEFDGVTFASPALGPEDRSFMYFESPGSEADFRMYFQPTMVVPPALSATTSSITNINIDSPLFTSARTYSTATNSYSQTIGSFPVGVNNSVAFKEAVNNRNCSMYQINKNILNNFEIPFRITADDGSALYQVQDPTKFYIRFSLWFYEQTDDERYYYIPTM